MLFRVILVAFAWLLVGCQAAFDANISSYINVQIPTKLHVHNVSGGMEHMRAHFGAHWDLWRQDGHMAMVTHYAEGNLCSMPNKNVTKALKTPYFLMADLGGCTPVAKARLAQTLGASGLIIVNNHCLCSEACEKEEQCQESMPNLWDDGSGASIVIPTMMIGKGNASHIIKAIGRNEPVLMEMAWHLPKFEHSVDVDLWYTPTHDATEEFLANFSALAMVLKDRLNFQPHHYILDGTRLECYQHADEPGSPCYEMCTNNGRYCSVSHRGIHGKDVVIESLRRMCLWKHHADKGFWEYLNHFNTLCQSIDFFSNKDCIKDVFKHSNIKEEFIEECMKDSGDVEKDDTNSMLADAMQRSEHIVMTPTVFVNHLPMKWSISTKSVFESFCMGFATGKAPHVCYACGSCGDPVACASRSPMHCNAHDGQNPEPSKSSTQNKKKKGGFGKFMLVVFILTGVGGYVYYKKYMEEGPGLRGYSLGEALMSDDA
mmetsp:Transcript_113155/g.316203  ORF Transcript_113155/g.316203 Transcript_113155/m.316203 type:complete len:487 (+) Transcript_113155:195-1655(+)